MTYFGRWRGLHLDRWVTRIWSRVPRLLRFLALGFAMGGVLRVIQNLLPADMINPLLVGMFLGAVLGALLLKGQWSLRHRAPQVLVWATVLTALPVLVSLAGGWLRHRESGVGAWAATLVVLLGLGVVAVFRYDRAMRTWRELRQGGYLPG